MALKFYGAVTPDPGEWFTWRTEGEQKLEVLVRRLPPGEERRIEAKHFGRKRRIVYAKAGIEQELDTEAQGKANREKAAFCMVDTRGFELEIVAAADAAELGKLLGEPVSVGKVVRLDGRWDDRLKETVFGGFPELVDFIGDKARQLRGLDAEAEQEVSGNSQPG